MLSQRTLRSESTRSTFTILANLASAMNIRMEGISMTTAWTRGRSRATVQPTFCASALQSSMETSALQLTIRRSVSPSGQNCARAFAAEKVRTRRRNLEGFMDLV